MFRSRCTRRPTRSRSPTTAAAGSSGATCAQSRGRCARVRRPWPCSLAPAVFPRLIAAPSHTAHPHSLTEQPEDNCWLYAERERRAPADLDTRAVNLGDTVGAYRWGAEHALWLACLLAVAHPLLRVYAFGCRHPNAHTRSKHQMHTHRVNTQTPMCHAGTAARTCPWTPMWRSTCLTTRTKACR